MSSRSPTNIAARHYDVSPDGRRFLMIKDDLASESTPRLAQFIIVLNWFDELKRLVSTN